MTVLAGDKGWRSFGGNTTDPTLVGQVSDVFGINNVAAITFDLSGTTFIGGQASFKVTDFDAHSWDEVYFNRIGWVSFDPTPAAAQVRVPAFVIGTVTRCSAPVSTAMAVFDTW